MHGDLSSHLHTDECNQLIQALLQCHREHPYGRFFGKCNEENSLMDRCLAKEREDNRQKNKEKARANKQKIKDAYQRKHTEQNV